MESLEGMFGSLNHACTINICITLATMKKGMVMIAMYYMKMKTYADEMVSSGQPLGDEERITYILIRMYEECYNPLVSSIVAREEPISPPKLYSQMLSYEHCVDSQSGSSFVGVFCTGKNRVVKITHSSSEMVL
jgi:hypothetical protein